jgi:phospholipid/cholesterol/gamma-HCH transport system substrate-binding protein
VTKTKWTIGAAIALVLVLIGGLVAVIRVSEAVNRTHITAYFSNATGIFSGDDVRILGVRVGAIETIEAQPQQVKITFWVDDKYKVPAEAKAVILSPSLVSARAIQLLPAYAEGPALKNDAVIPVERTAVPVEWDDLRQQLAKLAEALQPTQPGGVSTLGAFVNTAADNLRGEGVNIHDTITKLSTVFSALGDHSDDIFTTIKDLSLVVSALQDSKDLMRQLNQNLAGTTQLLANQSNEVGRAITDINAVAGDVARFTAENREPIGIAADKLASISVALHESIGDIEQTLHVAPTQLSNFVNIYPPAIGGFAGAFSLNNFANPIQFLCGAIQAASRLNAEQSAKLCVQYLAPIVKNRQYNFPPLGMNPFVGAYARPNEITYSEDWMRPDYIPPAPPAGGTPLPAEAPLPTVPLPAAPPLPGGPIPGDPTNLQDMMIPHGAGS